MKRIHEKHLPQPFAAEMAAIRPSKQRRWKIPPSTGEDGETSVRPAVAAKTPGEMLSENVSGLNALITWWQGGRKP